MIDMPALKAAFIGIFFFATVIGNSLVLHIGIKNWGHTSRHITHFLVFNMSIADMVVSLLCMPFEFTEELLEKWIFGKATCKIVEYVQASALGASVFIITFIAVDRYLCIVRPLTAKIKPHHGKYIAMFCWFFPALVSIPYLVIFKVEVKYKIGKNETTIICESKGLMNVWLDRFYWSAEMYFTFILPLLTMVFCYTRLLKKILSLKKIGEPTRQQSQQNQSSSDPIAHNLHRIKLKSVKLTIAFVSLFLVCWTPKIVMESMRLALGTHRVHRRSTIYEVALFMSYLNETLNPVLYAMLDPYFSDKMYRLFGRKENPVGTITDTSG